MNPSIKGIATGALGLLLTNPVVALPQKTNQPVTVAKSQLSKDTLIVPGERVGPITHTTTKQDLAKLFGASHLVDKTISGAEGIGSFAATQVNLNQGRSLLVVWTDKTRTKPLDVRNLGSTWKSREGIGIGTPLSELRKKLGNFKLFGLAWDYGGTILLESSRLSRYQGQLILRVNAAPNAAEKYPNDYQAVSGDSTFSSSNPHWGPLGRAFQQKNRAVVLIDEIDKADIDFPNDLLLELDERRFVVEKTGEEIEAKAAPIVLITSNDEKDLPDAFLRRCLFHYVEFPSRERLIQIINALFPASPQALVDKAIVRFLLLREEMRKDKGEAGKKVSTSELIDWFRVLRRYPQDEALAKLDGKIPFGGVLLKSWDDHIRYLRQSRGRE